MSTTALITEALRGWLDVSTWHSGHSLDNDRFYRAMRRVIATAGKDWSEGEFEDAVRDILGEKGMETFDEHIRHYIALAGHIKDYEKAR